MIETIMLVLEWTSTAIGVLTVLCLIYEKYWAWPLGVLFCFLSAPVLWHSNLYGYLTLTIVGFLPMNIYGWYYWLAGTEHKQELPITNAKLVHWLMIVLIGIAAVYAFPHFFALIVPNYFEEASYIYLDNTILVLSLAAMWFTARKYIQNWFIWFVVNVGSVTLYALLDLWGLFSLYCLYIAMAVWGYLQWQRSKAQQVNQSGLEVATTN